MQKLPVIAVAMFFALGSALALAQAGGAGAGGAGAGGLVLVPELALGRAVQVGLVALEGLADPQEVPVAAIPEWISKKQVEKKECRRRDRTRIRQAASSLDAPRPLSPVSNTSAKGQLMKLTTIVLSSVLTLGSTLALAQGASSRRRRCCRRRDGRTRRSRFLQRHQERQAGPEWDAGRRARFRFGQRLGDYSRWRDGRTGWCWFFRCR